MRNVIFVSAVLFSTVRFEEIITRGQLKCHASHTPDICRCIVASAENHLQRAVLPCLNVVSEMLMLEDKDGTRCAQQAELTVQQALPRSAIFTWSNSSGRTSKTGLGVRSAMGRARIQRSIRASDAHPFTYAWPRHRTQRALAIY